MKRKVLEINAPGVHFKGYHDDSKLNPYVLYEVWWDRCDGISGKHQKKVGEWASFSPMAYAVYNASRIS